ncbi:MAG: hypothetical protein EXR11_12840 [Rhodospirillaceae bacterium]|nr:hypothetical protein [Rhodospirillaceae bacterium]
MRANKAALLKQRLRLKKCPCLVLLNNLAKVRDECLSIWAQTLKAVPKSTLVIKDRLSADSYTRNRIINTLTAKGVDASRVEFIEIVPNWADHMRLYNRVDIALDTLPLNSSTTGFDALVMGTPLVALRGNWMGARMTSAMVKALGYEQWVAETPADYVRILSELAADKAALKAYKACAASAPMGPNWGALTG